MKTYMALIATVAFAAPWIADLGGTFETDAQGRVVGVNLRSSWISDFELKQLGTLNSVERLDLSHTRITDIGFKDLKALTNVRDLNLYYAEQVGDAVLTVARGWQNLRRLNLRGTKITDAGVAQLEEHPSLEAIDVGFSLFTDGGFEPLTTIPNLKELACGGNKVTDVGLNSLRLMPGLRKLDLSGAQRTDSGLWAATLTDRGVDAVATLTNLEELRIRGAKITDLGSAKLGALKLLRVLDVSETQLSSSGLKSVTAMVKLEQLSLYGCQRVDDSVVAVLAELPSLSWVDLQGTKVTAGALRKLQHQRPKLRVVAADVR